MVTEPLALPVRANGPSVAIVSAADELPALAPVTVKVAPEFVLLMLMSPVPPDDTLRLAVEIFIGVAAVPMLATPVAPAVEREMLEPAVSVPVV